MAKNRLVVNSRSITVHTNSRIVRWLRKEGFTFRNTIRVGDPRTLRPEILAHEYAHTLQFEKVGTLRFVWTYAKQLLKHGYGTAMPLEADATAWMWGEWAKGNKPVWEAFVANLR